MLIHNKKYALNRQLFFKVIEGVQGKAQLQQFGKEVSCLIDQGADINFRVSLPPYCGSYYKKATLLDVVLNRHIDRELDYYTESPISNREIEIVNILLNEGLNPCANGYSTSDIISLIFQPVKLLKKQNSYDKVSEQAIKLCMTLAPYIKLNESKIELRFMRLVICNGYNRNVLQYLIKETKFDVNTRDEFGRILLDYAYQCNILGMYNSLEIMELLTEKGEYMEIKGPLNEKSQYYQNIPKKLSNIFIPDSEEAHSEPPNSKVSDPQVIVVYKNSCIIS
ncbi:hypothetical protein [Wolbachia endosymbiont of Pentidionis agamae]|uniref:hypothetical protein n=1 Tax=Wolbachia endosymbiont of Pentidionis agamae TaxID=3110435 RepID=UPI002FD0A39D